jgi:hypothetical protein
MSMRLTLIIGLIGTLSVGCATRAPVVTRCGDVEILQNGQALESDGLSITAKKAPWTLRYVGTSPTMPWLHVSDRSSPVTGLEHLPHKDLLLVDQGVIQRSKGHLYTTGYEVRNAASAWTDVWRAMGDIPNASFNASANRYVARLQVQEFDGRDAEARPIFDVDQMDGRPMSTMPGPSLYLTLFGNQQLLLNDPKHPRLNHVQWTSCSVYFRQ